MRLARIAALLGLLTLVLIAGSAALIAFNQSRIVVYVLASVRNRTGVDIIPRSSSVHLSTHLIVVLDEPQVIANGHEIVKLKSLKAIISYHSVFTATGLPLYRLTATNPEITLPIAPTEASTIPVPRPGPQVIDALNDVMHSLARIAWSVEAIDASIRYADGTPLADRVEITAYRTHREPNRWRIAFDAAMLAPPITGAHLRAGDRRREHRGVEGYSPSVGLAMRSVCGDFDTIGQRCAVGVANARVDRFDAPRNPRQRMHHVIE